MTNTSLLLSGHSHSCDVGLACALGLEAAHVFNHIIYWLRINAKKKSAELIDGKFWMYETQKEIAECLGYLSEDQVCRAIKKLIENGLIIAENHNSNKFLKTNWYTVTDQSLITENKKMFSKPQNCGMDTSNLRNPDRISAEYINKEHKEKPDIETNNNNNNAAAVGGKNFPSETINYKTPSGKEKSISESEIYKHFLTSNFKTETITEAIQIVKTKDEPIGNIIKLLEAMCFTIENKPENNVKSKHEKLCEGIKIPPKSYAPSAKINPWAKEILEKDESKLTESERKIKKELLEKEKNGVP